MNQYIDKGKPVISDYHIYKNLIFGERTLKGTKREKYREIYHVLTDDLPKPDIILYIRADLDTLLARIAKRGRPFEEEIAPAYLQQLIEDYDVAMASLALSEPSTVIVTIDGNQVDFVENQADFNAIASQLKELMK
ncbi:Deoxyguanosine kinase [compost metagenome]